MAHEAYPWDEWFDGYIWELRRGTDFLISAENMRICVYQAARRRKVRVRNTTIGENVLLVQRFTPDPDLEEFEKEVERIRKRDRSPNRRGRPPLRRRK